MKMLKKGIALVVSLVMALGMTVNAFANYEAQYWFGNRAEDNANVTQTETFEGSVAAVNATSGNAETAAIELLSDVTVENTVTINSAADVTITSAGDEHYTIEAASTDATKNAAAEYTDANGKTFCVNTGDSNTFNGSYVVQTSGSVTLTNVTVDANGEAVAVNVLDGSKLTLNGDTAIKEGNHSSYYGGGVLIDVGGTMIMNGNSSVTNCYSYNRGGGVENTGTLIMNDNSMISNNAAREYAGGVINGSTSYASKGSNVSADGIFTMNGGSVSGNYASKVSGGVNNTRGTFTMNDGTISNNVAVNEGSGVRVYGGTFEMTGGTISNNDYTEDSGTGEIIVGDGTISITGGTFANAKTQAFVETQLLGQPLSAASGAKTYSVAEDGTVTVTVTEDEHVTVTRYNADGTPYVEPDPEPEIPAAPVEIDYGYDDSDDGDEFASAATTIADEETPLAALPLTFIDGFYSREEFMVALYDYAEAAGFDVSARADITAFLDASDVSEEAYEAMQWAVAKGILLGDAMRLLPQGDLSEEHYAIIMARFEAYLAANTAE